jgi:hypothetical protein
MTTNSNIRDFTDPTVSNNSSLHTDYSAYTSSPGSAFYSDGGFRDPKLKCQFICESPGMQNEGQPAIIELDLAPSGVSWDYDLRTQVYNTIGGQVIQILGVDIKNVKITGRFGFESWFGKKFDGNAWTSLYHQDESIGKDTQYIWNNDSSIKNGLMQMAHWFRAYFKIVTQSSYDQFPMYFSYPHRGWWWPIRPKSFPTIRFSQEDFGPVWTVEADYLQYLQDTRIEGDILSQVQADIQKLTPGVGIFTDFLNFSDPNATLLLDKTKLGTITNKYGQYVTSSGIEEALNLYNNGMSFPLSASYLTDLGIKVKP